MGKAISTHLHIRHLGMNPDGIDGEWFEVGTVRRMKVQLDFIESVASELGTTNDPAFYQDRRGYRTTRLGRELWHVMRNMDEVPESILEGRRLTPLLRILLPLLRKWNTRLRYWLTDDGDLDVSAEYPRRMICHVVYVIRRVVRSKKYRAAMIKDKRRAADRYDSCANYMLDIFRACAKVLILRVDLYFEGEGKLQSDSPEARHAFDKLIRDLSEGRVIPDAIGYIDRVEDGLERRLHHHFVCLCDGHFHQDGYSLSEAIGKHWVNECVGSPVFASYKNCWLRRREYPFNCLGVVHYTDSSMLMGLRLVLEYLAKDEPYIYLRDGYGKALRKGQSPYIPGLARRGAPRKRGNDLSVAEQVLLTEADPVPTKLRPPPEPRRRINA